MQGEEAQFLVVGLHSGEVYVLSYQEENSWANGKSIIFMAFLATILLNFPQSPS